MLATPTGTDTTWNFELTAISIIRRSSWCAIVATAQETDVIGFHYFMLFPQVERSKSVAHLQNSAMKSADACTPFLWVCLVMVDSGIEWLWLSLFGWLSGLSSDGFGFFQSEGVVDTAICSIQKGNSRCRHHGHFFSSPSCVPLGASSWYGSAQYCYSIHVRVPLFQPGIQYSGGLGWIVP